MKVPVLGRNLPNCITAARMVGALCLIPIPPLSPAFYGLHALAGVTDALDGWAARRMGCASALDAKLDSLADLAFYGVTLAKLLPALWAALPHEIWYAAAAVLALRLSAYLAAAARGRGFASLHTPMNKLTGAAVFLLPYGISLPVAIPLCWATCAIAAAASGEELWMYLGGRTDRTAGRSIFERSGGKL